ncbi:sensor histidine kinase [Actinacidiphila yanglinensis]|uniref:sensor histidine kinase n=1 Tax=Actinacidiphila yanglinensis TaxID=310779 RepID=UPI002AFDCF17|nr:sensor histidine kinase [Actinacidiphila yanglinensis]
MTYENPQRPHHRGLLRARSVWVPVIVLTLIQVGGTRVAGRHQPDRTDLDALGYVLLLAGPAMLLFRRRQPVAVAAGTAAVTLLYIVLGYPYGPVFLAMVVAFFSAVASGHRRAVLIIAALTYAAHILVGTWLYQWLPPSGDRRVSWTEVSGVGAWLLAVLAAAELFRVRREQIARDRRERAEAERRKVDEERLRIARELHDVLAHSISVINVQAGVALALMDKRPEQARTALTTIKAASKEALGEVRQVLGTLRAPGEAPRSPAPGLDRLPELVEQATVAGLAADVAIEGDRVPLSPGTDLAAFRIVQEALTNIMRHSGSRTARIRLTYRPDAVEVLVDDDGPAVAGGETGGGNGLVGMRERAGALGGNVSAGPRGDGGFRVRAVLPLAARAEDGDPGTTDQSCAWGPMQQPGPQGPHDPPRPPGPPGSSLRTGLSSAKERP